MILEHPPFRSALPALSPFWRYLPYNLHLSPNPEMSEKTRNESQFN